MKTRTADVDYTYNNKMHESKRCRAIMHLYRMMGIISSFEGNSLDATLVLKKTSSNIDTISDLSQIDDQKHIISKQFFPLINGGINIINISSDELVTSQYVNGFKTATLASIPANDLKVSTHSLLNFLLPTKNNTKLRAIRAFITL